MPTAHKICLMGFGNVRKYIQAATAGSYVHNFADCDLLAIPNELQNRAFEITPDFKFIEKNNHKTLCDIYKEVQKKYFPEKDIYKRGKS